MSRVKEALEEDGVQHVQLGEILCKHIERFENDTNGEILEMSAWISRLCLSVSCHCDTLSLVSATRIPVHDTDVIAGVCCIGGSALDWHPLAITRFSSCAGPTQLAAWDARLLATPAWRAAIIGAPQLGFTTDWLAVLV